MSGTGVVLTLEKLLLVKTLKQWSEVRYGPWAGPTTIYLCSYSNNSLFLLFDEKQTPLSLSRVLLHPFGRLTLLRERRSVLSTSGKRVSPPPFPTTSYVSANLKTNTPSPKPGFITWKTFESGYLSVKDLVSRDESRKGGETDVNRVSAVRHPTFFTFWNPFFFPVEICSTECRVGVLPVLPMYLK